MKKKNVRFLAGLLTAAMVLSMGGCGKKSDTESGTKTEKNDTANASDSADEAASTATGSNASADFSFADLQYVDFTFSSGAGAWETRLNIQADGSFSGEYWDMDMGSTGDGYPNGTQYGNTFTGTFTDLKKVNDYTYSMKLDKIIMIVSRPKRMVFPATAFTMWRAQRDFPAMIPWIRRKLMWKIRKRQRKSWKIPFKMIL